MLKNIIFDIGNTLLEYDMGSYLSKHFKDPALLNLLYSTIFKSEEWVALDRGIITEKAALKSFYKQQPQLKKEIAKVMQTWEQSLLPKTEALQCLQALKAKKYKIYLLSNASKKSFGYIKKTYAFPKIAKGYLISYQTKLIKPEKEIYERFLSKFKLKAEECLFIDDLKENLEAAEKLGIRGTSFEKAEKIWKILEEEC